MITTLKRITILFWVLLSTCLRFAAKALVLTVRFILGKSPAEKKAESLLHDRTRWTIYRSWPH